ncbi:hypothetical protein [Bradyrhizobium sp. 2TAF24]|uniref:hypothetical protein n=1 Tax=Bradyrhizobium sp. 2TAF24 TaxID=3233011 RepID=UPI003F92E431
MISRITLMGGGETPIALIEVGSPSASIELIAREDRACGAMDAQYMGYKLIY